MENYLRIGTVNFKHHFLPHMLLSLFLCLAAPLLLGMENLDEIRTAQVLEQFVCLTGIICLTPLFLPEQDTNIRDLLHSKRISVTKVHLIRLLQSLIWIAILQFCFVLVLKQGGCSFPFWRYYFGVFATALFLGGIGMCCYSIVDQIAVSYMLPLLYYILCFSGGSKFTGKFYLFSMSRQSFEEKYFLFAGGIFLLFVGIGFRALKRSRE